VKESGRDLILRYYHGIRIEELRKSTKNLPGQLVSGSIFEAGISRIRLMYVNYSTTTFGHFNIILPSMLTCFKWSHHSKLITLREEYKLSLMMEAARTSETSVDNYFTRQYILEDNSELIMKLSHYVVYS
jgi:hypothetical protein